MGWTHQMRIFLIFLFPAHQRLLVCSFYCLCISQMSQLIYLSKLLSINFFGNWDNNELFLLYSHSAYCTGRGQLTSLCHVLTSTNSRSCPPVCLPSCNIHTMSSYLFPLSRLSWYLQMNDDTMVVPPSIISNIYLWLWLLNTLLTVIMELNDKV